MEWQKVTADCGDKYILVTGSGGNISSSSSEASNAAKNKERLHQSHLHNSKIKPNSFTLNLDFVSRKRV